MRTRSVFAHIVVVKHFKPGLFDEHVFISFFRFLIKLIIILLSLYSMAGTCVVQPIDLVKNRMQLSGMFTIPDCFIISLSFSK